MLRGHPAILCTVLRSPLRLFKLGGYFPDLNFKTRCFMYWEEINVHWHFTIVFALVFITVQLQPIFVLFVAISLSYVAISRTCNMSEFYLNKASICIVHLTCYHQWRIRRSPPLIFRPSWGLTGLKKNFLTWGPPSPQGLDDRPSPPHPLSEGLDLPLTLPLGSPKEQSQG